MSDKKKRPIVTECTKCHVSVTSENSTATTRKRGFCGKCYMDWRLGYWCQQYHAEG